MKDYIIDLIKDLFTFSSSLEQCRAGVQPQSFSSLIYFEESIIPTTETRRKMLPFISTRKWVLSYTTKDISI